ncbi:MAG TPA: hypothetical protein VG328_19110 [Stellaceae bacterium]|jgi:hypothetical protein|nr:hypothetical protein [Stellaceae bacterium]
MERCSGDTETLSIDDLASRMSTYRERAAAVRLLADAITDKGATTGLLARAEQFENEARAMAMQIVRRAHAEGADDHGAATSSRATINATRSKPR